MGSDERDDIFEPSPPRIYANWVTPSPGPMDLALDFAYERPRGEVPDPEWLVTVVLAWEEVKILYGMLGRQIAQYEEHAGTIRDWEGEPPPFDLEDLEDGEPQDEEDD